MIESEGKLLDLNSMSLKKFVDFILLLFDESISLAWNIEIRFFVFLDDQGGYGGLFEYSINSYFDF